MTFYFEKAASKSLKERSELDPLLLDPEYIHRYRDYLVNAYERNNVLLAEKNGRLEELEVARLESDPDGEVDYLRAKADFAKRRVDQVRFRQRCIERIRETKEKIKQLKIQQSGEDNFRMNRELVFLLEMAQEMVSTDQVAWHRKCNRVLESFSKLINGQTA